MKHPGTPALKTKLTPPSMGDAVDRELSNLGKVISLSRGDIGVGGARLELSEDPAVSEGLRMFC